MIKIWLKAHARQLATLVLWLAVMVISHRWPVYVERVEVAVSAIALAVGIQLPPFRFSAEAISKLAKIAGGVMLLLALVTGFRAVTACDAPPGTFQGTTTAAAALAVDFSECVENDFLAMATSGTLSKDAALTSAEKCGIANVKDGLVLLVAAFNDVKNYLLAKHSQASDGGADSDAGAP